MSKKSYLSQQIKLLTLSTTDLFTDEEYALYQRIMALLIEVDTMESEAKKNHTKVDAERKTALLAEKKSVQQELDQLIIKHDGKPRTVRVSGVIDTRFVDKDADGNPIIPPGVTWKTLRNSRRIAEFCSDMSRTLGYVHNDVCFEKIILKWKSPGVLRQVVLDGFYLPLILSDGTVENRKFRFVTASAGQLRTDKVQCLSEDAWNRIERHVLCGLTIDRINAKGGLNLSKFYAYTALCSGATEPWPEINLHNVIVVKDFSGNVTGVMDYINPDYTIERGVRTVEIKHSDGAGMARPDVLDRNVMVRGGWIKGLITPFNWLEFCAVHGIEPKLTDAWGKEHDLVAEDIKIILTTSQFKLWKYYESWDEYVKLAEETGWTLARTNYEEDWIPDATSNYQFIESLVDFTDEEMVKFTQQTWDRIKGIANDEQSMLRTLRADEYSDVPYKRALGLYSPLLRDGYSRETLRAIKRRWTHDAQSGKLWCKSKRLFVIPDMYACCEHWFLGEAEPYGLLGNGEVACKVYRNCEKLDLLRSPHLYMEHAVRRVSHSELVYHWLNSNGIYTSCHDLVSRVLQFDCDGDQLNVMADETFISVAERNVAEFDVVPLFYDANEVPPELINRDNMFIALIRAHDSSGIGQISNNLCKLWNSDTPDYEAAKLLCYYNNQVIDGAKLPHINSYEKYPEAARRINAAVGGRNGRMPKWFEFSKNARHATANLKKKKKKSFKKANSSIMNRICERFAHVGNLNINNCGVAPFNYEMLLAGPVNEYDEVVTEEFCNLDNSNFANMIDASNLNDLNEKIDTAAYDSVRDQIIDTLEDKYGGREAAYPSVVMRLFTGDNLNKQSHKQMFWRVFGDIAIEKLEHNLVACRICPNCGMHIPLWSTHQCGTQKKMLQCADCGKIVDRTNSRQTRCPECQAKHRTAYVRAAAAARYMPERK